MKNLRRLAFFISTMLKQPVEILLLHLGLERWLERRLRQRIEKLASEAITPERSFALQLGYENLQRLHERLGEFDKAEELVVEQAMHPLLQGWSHYAYLTAAGRILEQRPDLARRYLQRAKDYDGTEISDREALEMIPGLERALAEAGTQRQNQGAS